MKLKFKKTKYLHFYSNVVWKRYIFRSIVFERYHIVPFTTKKVMQADFDRLIIRYDLII